MTSMFDPKKLGDVLRLHRGYDITKAQQSPGPYPVVRSCGIASYHCECKFRGPGVVIGRKGSLGTAFYLSGPYWPHDTMLYVEDFRANSPRYCFYLLQTLGLERYDVGASNPTLNRNHLRELPVRVPPPLIQDRVASVLSTYDDLIENNARRIAILEEMARRIFEEWFVHFRAPGCEGLPMVDSALGPIPQGWHVTTIKDVCERIDYGYTAKATSQTVGPKFLRITDIVPATIDWARVPYCEIPDHKEDQYLLRSDDIVVARTGATTGYAKRLNKDHPRSIFASYLVRLRISKRYSNFYVDQVVESGEYKAFVARNFGGAAQPNVNAQVLASMQIVVPPKAALNTFDRVIEAFIDLKEVLERGNTNLRAQRDLLLPKLVSGEIDLSDAARLREAAE